MQRVVTNLKLGTHEIADSLTARIDPLPRFPIDPNTEGMRRNAVEGATVALRQNRLYPFLSRRRGQERQRTVHASKVRSLDIPASVQASCS